MTADRELVDDISEEAFVGFSREELAGFSKEELEVEIHNVIKLMRKLLTKNGQEP